MIFPYDEILLESQQLLLPPLKYWECSASGALNEAPRSGATYFQFSPHPEMLAREFVYKSLEGVIAHLTLECGGKESLTSQRAVFSTTVLITRRTR